MSNSRRSIRNVVAAAVVAAAGVVPVISASVPVDAVSAGVVISQVYGGGGNSGAPLTNDFVELFNRGTSTVDLSGWSVQYASATGTGNFGSNPVVALSGTLAPGRYHLVQLAGGANGVALPAPDATGTINMSGTAGKVALVDTATGLACNGGSTPCAPAQLAQIVDLVGYGSANFFEGTAAPALTNTTAAIRAGGGCTDTDANGADFSAATPAPRNSASPANPCGVVAPVINEFVANHVGTDTNEYVEVLGAPSIDYSAFSVVQIEGDISGTATGVVDSVQAVGTTGPTGHWVTGFLSNALENGTLTLLLVEGFSGADGDDLDTDDDGVIDITPWTSVSDAVAVTDGGTSDRTYASTVLGADFDGGTFTPGGASRIPDGTDTDTTADWFRNDFDLAGVAGFTGTPVVGEALNTPGAANQAYVPADAAPAVVSTMPADAATDVAIDADVTVEFSEPVDVGADWFLLSCSASGDVGAVVSGGPTTFVLAPASDLALGETCTVTVVAAAVTDQDADDPPDAMAADVSWTFTTTIGDPCALPVTPIPVIQGSGAATPLAGQVVTTSGVVAS